MSNSELHNGRLRLSLLSGVFALGVMGAILSDGGAMEALESRFGGIDTQGRLSSEFDPQRENITWMMAFVSQELDGNPLPTRVAQAQDNLVQLLEEGTRLLNTGSMKEALATYSKALSLSEESKNTLGKAYSLLGMGRVYDSLGEKEKSLSFYNQALSLFKAEDNQGGEATTLINIGAVHSSLGAKEKAISFFNQALPLLTAEENRSLKASTLNNIGLVYNSLGEKEKALSYFNQALPLFKAVNYPPGEAITLNNIGGVYNSLGEKEKALSFYKQALPLLRAVGDRRGEAFTLNNIGAVYDSLGDKEKALSYYKQALPLLQAVGDRAREGGMFNNIGKVYSSLGKNEKALSFFNQALPLLKDVGDRSGEAATLNNIGFVYNSLGEKEQALSYFNRALRLHRAVGDRREEAIMLTNIGAVYSSLGKNEKALSFYNQALPIRKEVGDRRGEANTLNNIGMVYDWLGEKEKALSFFNQALPIRKDVGDRGGEASTLNNIGGVYDDLGEKEKALSFYNQALPLFNTVGDRSGEATTLSNIALQLADQQQSALAITLFKQSVNLTESLRDEITGLPSELQHSFTETVSDRYRYLANLLLQQGRIVEALQVLDLLKVQELQDFFRDVDGNEQTSKGLSLFPEETQIIASLDFSNIADLNAHFQTPQLKSLSQKLQATAASRNQSLPNYQDLNTRLQSLSQDSALLYPLILDDRLELILFTPNSPPIRKNIEVTEKELNNSISAYRQSLQDPNDSRILVRAQQLHEWLLTPLESALKQAEIKTIIYAPDGPLRYVPLAALYNGEQWAIEKYQINYVTAFGLTEIDAPSTSTPKIMAAAYTDPGVTTVNVNQARFKFGPIPAALPEVERVAERFPKTKLLKAKNFNREAMTSQQINQYGIVHLATHGKLVSGNPSDSFILLNNGEYVTLRELKNWELPNVDLVVLSACETALGEELGNGIEVIGFGYQLQVAQARAAIASLWQVSDDGTNRLMNLFYEQLEDGVRSPTAALGKAQQAMIQFGQTGVSSNNRGGLRVANRSDNTPVTFSHPYYWAPFILIGNGF